MCSEAGAGGVERYPVVGVDQVGGFVGYIIDQAPGEGADQAEQDGAGQISGAAKAVAAAIGSAIAAIGSAVTPVRTAIGAAIYTAIRTEAGRCVTRPQRAAAAVRRPAGIVRRPGGIHSPAVRCCHAGVAVRRPGSAGDRFRRHLDIERHHGHIDTERRRIEQQAFARPGHHDGHVGAAPAQVAHQVVAGSPGAAGDQWAGIPTAASARGISVRRGRKCGRVRHAPVRRKSPAASCASHPTAPRATQARCPANPRPRDRGSALLRSSAWHRRASPLPASRPPGRHRSAPRSAARRHRAARPAGWPPSGRPPASPAPDRRAFSSTASRRSTPASRAFVRFTSGSRTPCQLISVSSAGATAPAARSTARRMPWRTAGWSSLNRAAAISAASACGWKSARSAAKNGSNPAAPTTRWRHTSETSRISVSFNSVASRSCRSFSRVFHVPSRRLPAGRAAPCPAHRHSRAASGKRRGSPPASRPRHSGPPSG